jgi:hypothetical protein
VEELSTFAVPPAELSIWRGRKPKWLLEAEDAAFPRFHVALPDELPTCLTLVRSSVVCSR